ncbi:hypothetical protein NMG60_11009503 [Bertholletia excelsa]
MVHVATDEQTVDQLGDLNLHHGFGQAINVSNSVLREEGVEDPWNVLGTKDVGDSDVVSDGVKKQNSGVVAVDKGGGSVVVFEDAEAVSEGREEVEGARERELDTIHGGDCVGVWILGRTEKEKTLLDWPDWKKPEIPWS